MNRSEFLTRLTAGALTVSAAAGAPTDEGPFPNPDVHVERAQPGTPHAGKVLAAIQPHADDLPIFAAGVVLKLLHEGYTGYLIRTTNDDHTGPGTVGEGVLANERDNFAVARDMGLKRTYDLHYRNHMLDGVSPLELRLRLIFLFRLLKVDTVICYDPWSQYEENPDHYVTARAVEAACWMAGNNKDYPEHFEAGLSPHAVQEKYYFARGPQLVNRVVDITPFMDRKIGVNLLNTAQGPAGQTGAQLRRRLAEQGQRLPLLGNDDETANREYTRRFVLERDAQTGKRFGLSYAEPYHYIGPQPTPVETYIRENAVKL
ncbi:MAG: PIG-L family deacetylase [Bryobacteraceae bacterium]